MLVYVELPTPVTYCLLKPQGRVMRTLETQGVLLSREISHRVPSTHASVCSETVM